MEVWRIVVLQQGESIRLFKQTAILRTDEILGGLAGRHDDTC